MGFGQPVPRKKDPREITPTPQAALPAHLTPAALTATYARFVDQNGNPLSSRHVVIKVDSATGEILDIVAEA